jgi:hypothetical protein
MSLPPDPAIVQKVFQSHLEFLKQTAIKWGKGYNPSELMRIAENLTNLTLEGYSSVQAGEEVCDAVNKLKSAIEILTDVITSCQDDEAEVPHIIIPTQIQDEN